MSECVHYSVTVTLIQISQEDALVIMLNDLKLKETKTMMQGLT